MTGDKAPMRLGELLILAALWMLFGFMIWYYLSAFHGAPARWLAGQGLSALLGDAFYNIIPNPDKHYLFQVQTRVPFTFPDGSTGPLGFIVNPLVYGYGLPLLFGLIMATDQALRHKLVVLLVGWVAITGVQAWGVFWESLKTMVFSFGGAAQQAVLATGMSESVIALCYQLGALILPALAPVIVWVLGSRTEIERFIRAAPAK
ncbi:hypothetical protein F3N42_10405 [Marinihelvus fidelis]|uniref:Uncharacterized protein n=1 Tax=Marinihelvus fidelis TaxID=2613842 RepID=A0A5N0T9G5_9GAMM|nr:exosortase H-associated membrane protein [Marinihelvus fidelis]KAA9130777.1 hypothetical protein F3N42_10405 [Marinihelvus fidelis]